jgi:hypothetical protein
VGDGRRQSCSIWRRQRNGISSVRRDDWKVVLNRKAVGTEGEIDVVGYPTLICWLEQAGASHQSVCWFKIDAVPARMCSED